MESQENLLQTDGGVYILRCLPPEAELPGHSARIDADERGRVLFRERVDPGKIAHGFEECLRTAASIIAKTAMIAQGFVVEKITLKLAVDSKVGCAFIVDAGVEASLEVEIVRHTSPSLGSGG